MYRWFKNIVVWVFIFIFAFPLSISADMGPKPSVVVDFSNLGEEPPYWITLLSEKQSTGPYSYSPDKVAPSSQMIAPNPKEGTAAWNAFRSYQDTDGFYFIEYFSSCNSDNDFAWTYFPPQTFKILVWFPQTNTFAVSDILERYAFDSYYTATLQNGHFTVKNSYDYTKEGITFAGRFLLTFLIEMLIAIPFGLLKIKNRVLYLLVVNSVTQILLNVLLNWLHYSGEVWLFWFWYFWLELLVIAVEIFIYCRSFRKVAGKKKIYGYVVVSNVFSFICGIWISSGILPQLF